MSFLEKHLHRSEKQKTLDSWAMPPIPEKFKGWVYRDLPRLTQQEAQEFRDLVGLENIYILTWAMYDTGEERGQIFLSPQGQQRLQAAIEAFKN